MDQPNFLHHIRRLLFSQRAVQSSDAELLGRYCRQQDGDAFTTLVQRHGPAVWRVCRRMIRDEHLAEDAFQATILVLARRAASIRRPEALGGWLHGVATRLALKARLRESKWSSVGPPAEEPAAPDDPEAMTIRELRTILDEELLRLPDKLRYPLVLCYLEGKTRDEAAQQLDCPLETLKSRLERGRELLQARLQKRQLALPTALLSLLVSEGTSRSAPPAPLLLSSARAATRLDPAAADLPPRAMKLAEECLAGMRLARMQAFAGVAFLLGVVAATGLLLGRAFTDHSVGTAASVTNVFAGPPAPVVPRLRADLPAVHGPLRRLVVEERVGVRRQRELVRVPLFFHAGECRDPHGLQVFAAAEPNTPIPYQPDDIRRDQDGSVSRMHIYFLVDLRPWERQRFVLVAGENPGKHLAAMDVKRENGRVTFAGDDLQLAFWIEGKHIGAIAGFQTSLGKVTLPAELLAPRLTLQRQTADLKVTRRAEVSYQNPEAFEVRDLRFGSGPLFAKLIVRVGPKGKPDSAEFTYHVPRHGHLFIQTERLFPDDPESGDVVGASANALLAGQLMLGDAAADQRIVAVPAGLRRLTRSTQGLENTALVNARAGLSLMPIPCVQTERKGIEPGPDGELAFVGSGDFQRTAGAGSDDLRAFWGQTRFVFSRATTEEDLWNVGRAHAQPLTAVVDEPGVAADDLHQRLQELMKQFPRDHARSWMQEAGRLYTLGDTAALKKLLAGGGPGPDETVDHWLGSATQARAQLTRNGTVPLKESEKARASGLLDPWQLTYGASPLFALASLGEPSDRLDRICLAIGRAQRQFNGRVDGDGFPAIDCFNSAFNMQIGSIHAGIHGARKADDADLIQFYRDCARAPRVLDLGSHGFRAYPTLPESPARSDQLYQNTCDYYLRTVELACQEDLWMHPVVFGRYFDCIDVNADLCHRSVGESGRKPSGWYRANFFRGQCHDQAWESWSVGPFLGLLARASDQGAVGLTEACFYARHLSGRSLNWVEITTFFHTDLALREGLRRYRPEPAPALPEGVLVLRQDGQNVVRWKPLPVQDILGYRVYRADRMGGPWSLLNSPYSQTPAPVIPGTEYVDPKGKSGQVYFITAVDTKRRESRWFSEEPAPASGGAAPE